MVPFRRRCMQEGWSVLFSVYPPLQQPQLRGILLKHEDIRKPFALHVFRRVSCVHSIQRQPLCGRGRRCYRAEGRQRIRENGSRLWRQIRLRPMAQYLNLHPRGMAKCAERQRSQTISCVRANAHRYVARSDDYKSGLRLWYVSRPAVRIDYSGGTVVGPEGTSRG